MAAAANKGVDDWVPGASSSGDSSSGADDWTGGSSGADTGDGGAGQAFQYGMVESIPFGKSLGAGVETAESYLPKWMRAPGDAPVDQTGEGWSQRYSENLARIKRNAADLAANHPYATTAGAIAPMAIAPEMGTGRMALYGAGLGGAEGIEEGDSPGDIALKAGLGAAGGAAGSEVGKMITPAAGLARQTVLDAAGRLGVGMPKYSVGLPITQQMGKIGFSIPGMSTPLREASEKSIEGLGSVAERAAQGETRQSAGAAMKKGLQDWIGPTSQADVDAKYNAVSNLVNPNTTTSLNFTRQVARQIYSTYRSTGQTGMPGSLAQILDPLRTSGGLTYNGIKALRTQIGEQLDNSLLPANISKAQLKQIYGGLTNDLRAAAQNAGGAQGLAAHDTATAFAKQVAQNREQLVSLLGGQGGGSSDEQVFGAIQRAASSGNAADIALLRQAKQAVTQGNPQAWYTLARGTVGSLGRDPATGAFSPNRFLTSYGKISDAAKDELFGRTSQFRRNLDDLTTVSTQWKGLEKYANPSGTAGHAAGTLALLHGWHAPIETLSMFLGAKAFGKFLASDAGSGAVANFTRAAQSGRADLIRQASARIAASAGAQLGARVDPMALAAWAMHHYAPEAGSDDSGNMPQ